MSINKQFYFPCRYHNYYDLEANLSHGQINTSIEYDGETMADVLRATYKLRENIPADIELFQLKYKEVINKLLPTFQFEELIEHRDQAEWNYPADILRISYPDTQIKRNTLAKYVFELGKKIQSEASTDEEYYEFAPNVVASLMMILNHLDKRDDAEELHALLHNHGHYDQPNPNL